MDYKKKYYEWLESPYVDSEDKKELELISDNEKEIEDRFYTDLKFGTGGMRGAFGVGSNRINKYMVRKATQGLADYLLSIDAARVKRKGIVIAYDCRLSSKDFAENTALILTKNGIKVYLFESLRSTPELAFALRELKCMAGVVITASHNPPGDNGYKIYLEDGVQLVGPHAKGIVESVKKVENFFEIEMHSKTEAEESGLLIYLGKDMDDKYIETLKSESVNKVNAKMSEYKIVYTPLHGTGKTPTERVLDEIGLKNVFIVPSQKEADGNFPTVSSANPEENKSFKLGIEFAETKGADIVIATDPDADRAGIAIKNSDGDWIYPSGNEVGLLLAEYILKYSKEIPLNGKILSTVVSTPMLDDICEAYGVGVIRTLTGFKYIGEKIGQFENKEIDASFIFGMEESLGYLKGTNVRDKDGVIAVMLIAEMASFYYSQGSSLYKELINLNEKYGWFKDGLKSIKMTGKEGAEKIRDIIEKLRNNPPLELMGKKVVRAKDFSKQIDKNILTVEEFKIDLPKSNIIQLVLEDDTYITVRPSGTEPKIKYYFFVKDKTEKDAESKLKKIIDEFK